MKSILLALFVLTLFSACTVAYKMPVEGEDVAKLRLYAPGFFKSRSYVASVYTHADEQCGQEKKVRALGAIFQLGGMLKSNVLLDMYKDPQFDYNEAEYAEIRIPANKRFNFSYTLAIGSQRCDVGLSFLPDSNKQYESIVYFNNSYCYVAVEELVLNQGKVDRNKVDSFKMNKTQCIFHWN